MVDEITEYESKSDSDDKDYSNPYVGLIPPPEVLTIDDNEQIDMMKAKLMITMKMKMMRN